MISAHLIRPFDCKTAQQIRIDIVLWMRLTGPGFLVTRYELHFAHQPPHASTSDHDALMPQILSHLA